MNRWLALALLLAVAGALALRLPQLSARPLHNDEGVNAVKLAALWETGEYKYDPHEFHGPTLYYFSLPFLWLGSAHNAVEIDATRLRLVTVFFGVGLILLLPLLADGIGKNAATIAAAFIAVSPAMVFYSRYFIHEMLLVFFTLLTLGAAWRFVRTKKNFWAALAGVGLGSMFATKETFILSVIAAVLAAVATVLWNQWQASRTATSGVASKRNACAICAGFQELWPGTKSPVLVVIAAGAVWLILFTSFFTNWQGLVDSFGTYLPWLHRAGGASPHIHPWYFYFDRLLNWRIAEGLRWNEAAILALALVGAAGAVCNNRKSGAVPALSRFLVCYTVILAAIYSIISYKTPWCLLNFWVGAILLAGIGGAILLEIFQNKIIKAAVLIGLVVVAWQLAGQSKLAGQNYAGHRKNPYVYAQTTTNLLALVERAEAVARFGPEGDETVVKIISPDSYGPLPWFLRRFKNTGWWEKIPEDPYSPIVIVSAKLDARLDEKSDGAYVMTGMYEMHPGSFLELYIERRLWEKFVESRPLSPDD